VKEPLRWARDRREDNIKMDVKEIWCGDVDWICLTQERDQYLAPVNTVMNFQIP
jgi:hypothetical protein